MKKFKKDKRRLKNETIHSILAVLSFTLAIFFILSAFNLAAGVGKIAYSGLKTILGLGYFVLPLALITLAVAFLKNRHNELNYFRLGASALMFFSLLGIIDTAIGKGGRVGELVAWPFSRFFGTTTSLVFLTAISVISILVLFDTGINFGKLIELIKKIATRKKIDPEMGKKKPTEEVEAIIAGSGEALDEKNFDKDGTSTKKTGLKIEAGDKNQISEEEFIDRAPFKNLGMKYVPIPISLIEQDRGKPGVGDIKANVNIIKRTLQNFGIDVEMDEVTIGPSVTRYALKPAEGVKLSRIVGLQNDLAMSLAAHPIRIEAPIPGKSLVGVEIPNKTKTTVGLGSMVASEDFQKSDKPLFISMGKSIAGKSVFGNLGKMPHLLIAGATGSGKSVSIHAIITSLLYRNSPENLKFIMIDPKRVELTLYNGIPHLYAPVITEAKKAILALKWAAKEMDRRYDILEAEKVRDIDSYHKNILEPAIKNLEKRKEKTDEEAAEVPEPMPYIVIIIDELADIMSTYPRELEAAVVRLAQMSRAVGIHLILSTQRPSVNVITGLIKANIPARVALQVASQVDSRTILDSGGAEKLLGAGDMLYLSAEMSKPERLQSPFISEGEVKKVTKFIKDAYADELMDQISLTQENGPSSILESMDEKSLSDDADEDDLYEAAREEIIRSRKASTSYLQRKLSVGYARAARLMDLLEEKGVVGPAQGAKPREILVEQKPEDETEAP